LPLETVDEEERVVVIVCEPLPAASIENVCVLVWPELMVNDLLAVVICVSEKRSPADKVTSRSTLALPVELVSFVTTVSVVLVPSVTVAADAIAAISSRQMIVVVFIFIFSPLYE
jgi:hypothetical protein